MRFAIESAQTGLDFGKKSFGDGACQDGPANGGFVFRHVCRGVVSVYRVSVMVAEKFCFSERRTNKSF